MTDQRQARLFEDDPGLGEARLPWWWGIKLFTTSEVVTN